jgi:hypothetical protein
MKISASQNHINILDSNIKLSYELESFLSLFKPIKINHKQIKVLDQIYSVGYCYFDLTDILEFPLPLVHVKILQEANKKIIFF